MLTDRNEVRLRKGELKWHSAKKPVTRQPCGYKAGQAPAPVLWLTHTAATYHGYFPDRTLTLIGDLPLARKRPHLHGAKVDPDESGQTVVSALPLPVTDFKKSTSWPWPAAERKSTRETSGRFPGFYDRNVKRWFFLLLHITRAVCAA